MRILQITPSGMRTRLVALAVIFAASLPAAAAGMEFFGTVMAVNPPAAPTPTCNALVINKNEPPLYKTGGFSNLGDFLWNQIHCINPLQEATFTFDFGAGNTLHGTYNSTTVPSPTPGVFQVTGSYDVTGGTGTFQGYVGSLGSLGNLDRRDPEVADFAAVFRGTLVPVPEPAAWSLMLAGLAGVAGIARRRAGAAFG